MVAGFPRLKAFLSNPSCSVVVVVVVVCVCVYACAREFSNMCDGNACVLSFAE